MIETVRRKCRNGLPERWQPWSGHRLIGRCCDRRGELQSASGRSEAEARRAPESGVEAEPGEQEAERAAQEEAAAAAAEWALRKRGSRGAWTAPEGRA